MAALNQVKAVEIPITRKGEVRHFELRLPRRGVQITGVESGARFITAISPLSLQSSFVNSVDFQPTRVLGELRLEDIGKAGMFYATHVREEERNMGFADFSVQPKFRASSWSRARKRDKEPVQVISDTSIILGVYRDLFGLKADSDVEYILKVQLWYQQIEEQ